jgi:hypothetical protein
MKQYPEITADIRRDIPVYAFDKIDGSNIRAEWSRKRGFYKFGSRKVLIDSTHPLGEAENLIRTKYEDDLSEIFRKQRFERVICFFELSGKRSFAGRHTDEEHDVLLIDVNPYKKGILPPAEFLKLVGDLDLPGLLYRGNANREFEESVRNGTLLGMTFEGVVCKAKNPKRTPMPLLFKIKSRAWYQRLREYCAGNDELYKKLA